jgi:hypothetical protein
LGPSLPTEVLWNSIGSAAPSYEIFTGCAEVLAGILLVIPSTTMLGALICLADMVQVFMLNVSYDVGVKLLSFHLLLLTILLLAPEFERLANVFVLNRTAGPSTHPQLFHTRRANQIALAVQILFGAWLLGMHTYKDWQRWHVEGGAAPKPPLYGIWNVEEFSIDGQVRAPLLTDNERWRRAIFEYGAYADTMFFQRMNDSIGRYAAAIEGNTILLTKNDDKKWRATLGFQRESQDHLTLDGVMDGHTVHIQLVLFDSRKFQLVNHRFTWFRD